jgi:hypothetical protein
MYDCGFYLGLASRLVVFGGWSLYEVDVDVFK